MLNIDSLRIIPLEWQVSCLVTYCEEIVPTTPSGAFDFFFFAFTCPLKDYFYYFTAYSVHAPTLDMKFQLLKLILMLLMTLFAGI